MSTILRNDNEYTSKSTKNKKSLMRPLTPKVEGSYLRRSYGKVLDRRIVYSHCSQWWNECSDCRYISWGVPLHKKLSATLPVSIFAFHFWLQFCSVRRQFLPSSLLFWCLLCEVMYCIRCGVSYYVKSKDTCMFIWLRSLGVVELIPQNLHSRKSSLALI